MEIWELNVEIPQSRFLSMFDYPWRREAMWTD